MKFLGVQGSEVYQNISSKVKDKLLRDPVGECLMPSRDPGHAVCSRPLEKHLMCYWALVGTEHLTFR